MFREIAKSKIMRATVTQAELDYVGSITIDEDLMEKADLIEGEKVLVVDFENGARLETYVIKGERGSGVICTNGPAARLIEKGDLVAIIAFAISEEPIKMKNILVDENNKFVKYL